MSKKCIKKNCQHIGEISKTGRLVCVFDGIPIENYTARNKCVLDMSSYERKKVKAVIYDNPQLYKELHGAEMPS